MEIFRTQYLDAALSSLQLGLTSFADMSLDEYKTHALGYRFVSKSSIALLATISVSPPVLRRGYVLLRQCVNPMHLQA